MIQHRRHTRTTTFLLLIISSIFLLSGCFPKPSIPIPRLDYGPMDASENKNLLILLRGIGGKPEDFEKYGLIEEIRSRNLPFDVVVPNAHFGYYKSETLEERLKEDIIDPARAKGYQEIWLAGFSMGGLGSLFYLRSFADDVNGVILSSPFMGWETILKEIDAAGGIQHWTPNKESDNWQQLIWRWVQQYQKAPSSYPPIYLGYGAGDVMTGNGPILLSTALSKERVFTVPGGHTYKTFKKIWKTHMDRLESQFQNLPR